MRLDRAICLVHDGDIDEAARLASLVLTALPQEHRSPIIIDRARELTLAIPPDRKTIAAVREFRALLAPGALV